MKRLILALLVGLFSTGVLAETNDPIANLVELLKPKTPSAVTIVLPASLNMHDTWIDGLVVLASSKKIADMVLIKAAGMGGDMVAIAKVIDAIKSFKKYGTEVVYNVIGPAISGHAIAGCYADKVIISKGGSMSFHAVGGYASYLFGALTIRSHGAGPDMGSLAAEAFYKCVEKGILTAKDVESIVAGKMVVVSNVGGIMTKVTVSDYYSGYLSFLEQLAYLVFLICAVFVGIGIAKRI